MTKRALLPWLILLVPLPAYAGGACTCKDLPRMERELLEDIWIANWFQQYAQNGVSPGYGVAGALNGESWWGAGFGGQTFSNIDQLEAGGLAAFQAWLDSPAGGGGGTAGGRAYTDQGACKVYFGPDKNPIPLDGNEDQYRKSIPGCDAIANQTMDHERHHVATCQAWAASGQSGNWDIPTAVAAEEAAAYATGGASLRKEIAALAAQCGWKGSVNKTRKDLQGKDVPVVPSKGEIDGLKGALMGGRP